MTPTDHTPATDGTVMIGGKQYMPDARGGFTPLELIKPQDKLQDEIVRKVIGFARDLSAQIARFKGHTFEDLSGFDQLLEQQYKVTTRGQKGNRTYISHDGLLKVQVQRADLIDFGPELQQAKALIDQCLTEWTDLGRAEIRALIRNTFNVEREGKIAKSSLLSLLKLDIADERWVKAMDAVRDAIRVVGAKQYFRFYDRPNVEAPWQAITIALAQA